MFCTKCGTKNPDNANFCQGCGSPLTHQAQQTTENSYQSPPNPDPTVYSEPAPESPSAALRKVTTSGLFRFTAFAFCALILSNILSLIDTSFMWGVVTQILGDVDMGLVNDMSRYLGGISSISAVFSQIPLILVAVGLWITYATASKKGERFNTAGLTIIKVIYTIELVAMCVVLALCMVIMLIASLTATNSENAMFVFACVICLDIVFGITIFWLAMIRKSLNAAKEAATEEHGKHVGKNASTFVGVVCYICGGIDVIFAILSLVSLSITGFCSCLIGAIVQICFGVLIFRFRGEMKKLK